LTDPFAWLLLTPIGDERGDGVTAAAAAAAAAETDPPRPDDEVDARGDDVRVFAMVLTVISEVCPS
jgi:hypothetical protein